MRSWAIALVAMTVSASAFAEEPVRLYAAGSLRAVMNELVQAYGGAGGTEVRTTFGASGLLRERLENGERADVFASADLGNAQKLADGRRSSPPIVFARNELCALAAPGVEVTEETLLERLLDPSIRLGTSTPRSDPSGDYTWQLFEKADKVRPGAFATLDAKARKMTGGPDSPPPVDRSVYGLIIAERKADVVLTYCTSARVAAREVPGARVVTVPPSLAVGTSYALVVLNDARPAARDFALFVLSLPGQSVLARHGFVPIAAPWSDSAANRSVQVAKRRRSR